jgi:hypothetical protein
MQRISILQYFNLVSRIIEYKFARDGMETHEEASRCGERVEEGQQVSWWHSLFFWMTNKVSVMCHNITVLAVRALFCVRLKPCQTN